MGLINIRCFYLPRGVVVFLLLTSLKAEESVSISMNGVEKGAGVYRVWGKDC